MTEPRMSDADYARYKPYVDEVIDLFNHQLRRCRDPQLLTDVWRIGLITALTEAVRAYNLLPVDMDNYLHRVCEDIIEGTKHAVRNWDERGPRR